MQVVQKAPAQRSGRNAFVIAHDERAPLGGVERLTEDSERKSRALGEQCNRNAVGQSHRVEHEFESDLGARHLKIPFGPMLETDVKYYLLLPEARAGEPSIDAFRAWIVDEAARFRTRLRDVARSAGTAVRVGVDGSR